MKYKLNGPDDSFGIINTETNQQIPNHEGNKDWQEYLQWKIGMTIDTDFKPAEALPGNPGPQEPDPQFDLTEAKTQKILELKTMCRKDIESGFESNATGTVYTYESTLKDQLNISGAAQISIAVDFTVIDSSGNKLRISHTPEQMTTVFETGVGIIQTKKTSLYAKIDQVNNAVDTDAVMSIVY